MLDPDYYRNRLGNDTEGLGMYLAIEKGIQLMVAWEKRADVHAQQLLAEAVYIMLAVDIEILKEIGTCIQYFVLRFCKINWGVVL